MPRTSRRAGWGYRGVNHLVKGTEKGRGPCGGGFSSGYSRGGKIWMLLGRLKCCNTRHESQKKSEKREGKSNKLGGEIKGGWHLS